MWKQASLALQDVQKMECGRPAAAVALPKPPNPNSAMIRQEKKERSEPSRERGKRCRRR